MDQLDSCTGNGLVWDGDQLDSCTGNGLVWDGMGMWMCGRSHLDPGEGLDDPDEVLLQQVVIERVQVGADDGVVLQLTLVLRQRLQRERRDDWFFVSHLPP